MPTLERPREAAVPVAPPRTLTIDGIEVAIENERNLLELVRKADIDLPTFCYHSELSIYGACRLCLVDVEGRGMQSACSQPPEPGLVVRTQTEEIREIRRLSIELLLANHDQECPTCPKSGTCKLQDLARRLGIRKVRFKRVHEPAPLDTSSPSLVRDPNKCVLCGDCVRVCDEIQGVGAIDFAWRGHKAAVVPAFGKDLDQVECVACGQCAAVCPTGALSPRSEIDDVWTALHDPAKRVVVQIAPAVRVALAECFGRPSSPTDTGRIVTALRRLGFDRVFDTAFSADLTVMEEAHEFLGRKANEERLPQFTSCCPAWVRFAEQYFPDLLGHLSSCRSPQQMLAAVARETLPAELGVPREQVVMVSIMPCTAKKLEARRPEFSVDGRRDVDHVLTTQELARMIEEAGIPFTRLELGSFDMPMGYKSGAGVIFGASGGVSEAVLRFAADVIAPAGPAGDPRGPGASPEGRPGRATGGRPPELREVRGEEGLRIVTLTIGDTVLRLGIVHGLANARRLAREVREGRSDLDLIEVMACPGGCIGGAGQPFPSCDGFADARRERTRGLYDADRQADLHRSQDNPFVRECYERHLGEVGGHRAHELLHTRYQPRRRIEEPDLRLGGAPSEARVKCTVCVGTSCFLKGSQKTLQAVMDHVHEEGLHDRVDVAASFCFESCEHGPTADIGGRRLSHCTPDQAVRALGERLADTSAPALA